ncbi:pentatricopeptide repeat-containing protein [Tanacetum coccineum]
MARQSSQSTTIVTVETQPASATQTQTITLTLNPRKKKVTWKEGTVDNEFLQKKSSKKCCIFHKDKPFDEDSSDDDEDHHHCHDHGDHDGCGGLKKMNDGAVQKEMAPSGLNALLFDVHYDGIFMFAPLRYENGVVYELRVTKDKKYDYDGLKIVECDSDLEAMYEFADAYGIIQMIHENRKKDAGNMSYEELVSWAEEEAQHLKTLPKPRTVSKKERDSLTPKKNDTGVCGSGTNVEFSYKQSNAPDVTLDVDEFDYGDTGACGSGTNVEFGYKQSNAPDATLDVDEFDYGDTGASVDDQTSAPSQADNGKGKMIEEDNIVNKVVDKGKGIVIEENDNRNVMDSDSSDSEVERDQIPDYSMLYSDSESEYSERSVDYLSEGEDELIQLRKRNSKAKRAPKEFMDDLVKKMRKCDDDTELTDPFKLVETRVEKYSTHDQDTHWRMKKPKVGEKFVFSLNDEHTCTRDFKFGTLVNYKWIGKHFGNKIRMNPDIKLHEIADMVMKKYKCIVSPCQCRRAKRWALNEGENTMLDHYGYIRSYAKAILESNVGSTVRVGVTVNPDDQTYFDRFYVCFNGLKEGRKKGCKRVIVLDGCFLKKPNVGEILTAIGRDGNNHIFPVAWVVVNVENKDNWSWFLELLGEDLELPTGNGLTLMSDQHKNGILSECFNAVLVRVRNKPLITMLEAMRVIVMERMNTMRRMLDKWTDDICPNIQKRLELIKDQQRFWHVIPAGGNLFEVRNGSQAYSIDEQHRTCSCRMWQLSGLPCSHAIAVIFKLNRRAEEYVPDCFRKRMFHDAYHQYFTPVGGMSFWPDYSEMSKKGCRRVIALDGCFLKKPNVGEILTAIGRDRNNHIFLVAWVVVNVENKDSGVEFRNLFWAASKASYLGLFNKIMDKIKRANPNAYQYLLNKDPMTWSRAYFHIGTNFEAVENGFSECFNDVLTDDICPNIQKRLELIKDQQRFWHVIPVGGNMFEVRNGSQAYSIDEQHRTCSCRMWQISVPPSIPIPPVEEHLGSSQYEVGGFMSMSGREETMHDYEIQESQTVQTAPTQSSQTATSGGIAVDNQVVPVNEPVPREPVPREPVPRSRRNFVIPRPRERSERILKKSLQRITQELAAQRQILTVWIKHKLNSTSFVSLCCGIRQYDVV